MDRINLKKGDNFQIENIIYFWIRDTENIKKNRISSNHWNKEKVIEINFPFYCDKAVTTGNRFFLLPTIFNATYSVRKMCRMSLCNCGFSIKYYVLSPTQILYF